MNRIALSLFFFVCCGCGTGGSSGGGAAALPSAGLGPYVWTDITVGDEKASFGPEYGAPFAIGVDGEMWLYLRHCADATGCRIMMAKSTDGLHFDSPQVIATHPMGLDHPVVIKENDKFKLFAMSSARDAVLEFTGSKTGEFRFKRLLPIPSVAAPLLELSVVELGARQMFLFNTTAAPTEWRVFHDDDEAVTAFVSELCGSPCELFSWPSLVTFKRARSRRGRELLRAFGVVTNNSGDNQLNVYGSFDGQNWYAYENNPVLSTPADINRLTMATDSRRFFIYAELDTQKRTLRGAIHESGVPSITY